MTNDTKNTVDQDILAYIASLPDKQRVAYEIAQQHLGTSFTIEKTVGFLRWKRQQSDPIPH
jgi:hypothetical protein